jgi:hypothetical protein
MPSLLSSRPGPRNTKKKNKILEPLLGFFFCFFQGKNLGQGGVFYFVSKINVFVLGG